MLRRPHARRISCPITCAPSPRVARIDGVDDRAEPHLPGVRRRADGTVRPPVSCPTSSPIPLGTPHPVAPDFLEGPNDGAYGYNACRDPWRLGTDFVVSGDARARTAAQRITTWVRGLTGDDPRHQVRLPARRHAAAPAQTIARWRSSRRSASARWSTPRNQAWLNDVWDLVVGTPLDAEGYYENTLKLLAMIAMSGNWWAPAAVSAGCTRRSTPLCTDGGYLDGLDVKLGGLGAARARRACPSRDDLLPAGRPAYRRCAAPARGRRQRRRRGLRAELADRPGAAAGGAYLRPA